MYSKTIKGGNKEYKYFYYNVKKNGRVKNIFLGGDKEEALEKLEEIKGEQAHNLLLKNAPNPDEFKGVYKATHLVILLIIILAGLGLFYFIGQTTGLITYNPQTVSLDVNNQVSRNAIVYVNVYGQEESKSITELITFENQSIFLDKFELNLSKFGFSLDPGTYSFTASLIDNSSLIAISSTEITIENGINATNKSSEVIPPKKKSATINEKLIIDDEVENELNNKGKIRVIIKKNQEIEKINLDELVELSDNNDLDNIELVHDARFREIKNKIDNEQLSEEDLDEFTSINADKKSLKNNLENAVKDNAVLEVKQSVDNLEAVEITRDDLEKLKQVNEISEILLDEQVSLFTQESIALTKIDEVKNNGYSGQGKKVCILDTGINYNLFGLELNNSIYGHDFVNNDDDPLDDNGHGTSVSSIVLEIAPNSIIYSAKVVDNNGNGYYSDVLAGLDYCINNNVDVISFSIGSKLSQGYCDADLVANKSNSAVDLGIYVVAAAGNDASNTSVRVPACGSKVTRVASSSKQDNVSSFSNVFLNDLLAPGENVNTINLNGDNVVLSGTSLSSPFVTGSALLMLENRTLNPSSLTYLLRSTSEIILYDNINYNRLNLWNALINNKTNEPYDYNANQTKAGNGTFITLVDTCTYTSGDWNINCYDNCTISTQVNVNNNNVNINGYGSLTLTADVINVNNVNVVGQSSTNQCIVSSRGGGFK
ncbi:MAG: S8 family serine peptidase [Nanoarchaeota archaeon]